MSNGQKRILIVDDEPGIRELLSSYFRAQGHEILNAPGGFEALAYIRREHIDLLFLDIGMPRLDGLEILRKLRELGRDFPVIILTAHDDMKTTIEAMKLGAFDFITKPFRLEDIEARARLAFMTHELRKKQIKERESSRKVADYLVGRHPVMIELYKTLGVIATTTNEFTVLIEGESGVGKEIVARVIHAWTVPDEPFVTVDCALLPENILEAELFGYEKGAFTGAETSKPGKFEIAKKGIIYLDEIGEMPKNLQAKLLRVLQTREFERLGGLKTFKTEARFISATNRNIEEMVKNGEFREDLYYRLNVIRIRVPPLRERKSDIPLLVNHFLAKVEQSLSRSVVIAPEAMEVLLKYDYPGNVRELEHIIACAAAFANNGVITVSNLPKHLLVDAKSNPVPSSREEITNQADREYITRVLNDANWNVTQAARIIGITRQSLHRIMKRYGITRAIS